MIITIDGPSASGKSTTAKALADKLGFYYLNTGLMYRASAWFIKKHNLKNIDHIPFDYDIQNGQEKIFVDGQDITDQLYSSEIAKEASILSQDEQMHHMLITYQRSFANKNNLVVEGRDSGSAIFPNAELKIYLTASDEIRAQRLLADKKRNNTDMTLSDAIKIIQERDKRDMERKVCPLVIPKNAIVIDNSDLTLQQTISKIAEMI